MPKVFLLDAPSLVYRAYFAWPTTLTARDGRPVNAVRGVMEMITRIVSDHRPDRLVAVFDADWRPAWRVREFPAYKSDRPDDPADLPPQLEMIHQVLDAAGIERTEAPELEADDAIATLVARKDVTDEVVIVTGDRDLLCLVRDPDVVVMFPVRGTKDMTLMDERAVEEKHGVPPARYGELAMLRGDSSDGLPGIAGIGPKRAADLLTRYGSIEGILARSADLSPRLRTALDGSRSYLAAARKVVTLVADARLESTSGGAPDEGALRALGDAYGLGSSAPRLLQALRGER